ncbi:AAA family ATPase [Candidatus Poribacteria bacterium]|nr:AAA family ATPase [Candidatus Poribacteria bacterium]
MPLTPWYKVAVPRKEVREGRSFNPDEFAIHLEQVVANTAPEDYRDPVQFFSRTSFTRALREHAGMVLRRLAGETANTSPVMTLVTQFGGGKTHTLTALYHLVTAGEKLDRLDGVTDLLREAKLSRSPQAKVAIFVGSAWDPQEGRETPWIDLAYQLAGHKGVQELGTEAINTPPGTEALGRVFAAANAPVLVLFDEVLNFVNRHRKLSDPFHAFLMNLTVAMTATTHGAAVISLPRSQVEMTDFDLEWQDKITKVVRRVAKDLIANDETEISQVVRRRLFDDYGSERMIKRVSKAYADWCFERRAQLPPEWMVVDSTSTESRALEHLRSRFESCYPFHPATLSVFQRKWQALSQFQQTRGTLAMLAQWISWAHKDGFTKARREPLITLGSAPLEVSDFRSVVLGQLGESRLVAAMDADIAGAQAHSRALDSDSKGVLRDIHRRAGTTILFESSGGQVDKTAHLPELRFALGEPEVDTTSVDTAAFALEDRAYFLRRIGSDGFKISHQPTMKKVVSDRRASLDEQTEIQPAVRSLIQKEFDKAASIPRIFFPSDAAAIQDSPQLSLVVADPSSEWSTSSRLRQEIAEWTKQRGETPRLYPGALVWSVKKPGRELREKVELWLAWKRVSTEMTEGTLGGDFDRAGRAEIKTKVIDAEEAARDEVWADYRYVVLADNKEPDGLKVIDLGAGHASSGGGLCERIITALKSGGILNKSVGAGYIERNWPPSLKESGAWPLASLRQSFLNGALTRLVDPDRVLKSKVVEFVGKGEFGLASGQNPDGSYSRVWFEELIDPEEVAFESDVFLLLEAEAKSLVVPPEPEPQPEVTPQPDSEEETEEETTTPDPNVESSKRKLRVKGEIPPESWNRLGTKLIAKLRSSSEGLKVEISLEANVEAAAAKSLVEDLRQALDDLSVSDRVEVVEE